MTSICIFYFIHKAKIDMYLHMLQTGKIKIYLLLGYDVLFGNQCIKLVFNTKLLYIHTIR